MARGCAVRDKEEEEEEEESLGSDHAYDVAHLAAEKATSRASAARLSPKVIVGGDETSASALSPPFFLLLFSFFFSFFPVASPVTDAPGATAGAVSIVDVTVAMIASPVQ